MKQPVKLEQKHPGCLTRSVDFNHKTNELPQLKTLPEKLPQKGPISKKKRMRLIRGSVGTRSASGPRTQRRTRERAEVRESS